MTFSNNIQGSDERTVDKVHSIVKEFVKQGVIKKERIDESFTRIMKLKGRLTQGDLNVYYQQALEKSNREVKELKGQLDKSNAALKEQPQTIEKSSRKKKRKKRN